MEQSGRKKSDGIKRLKKIKRTRVKTRSFDDESVSINIHQSREIQSKKRVKKSAGIVRSQQTKKKQAVVGIPRELPSLELNRGFYTPPKRTHQKKDYFDIVRLFIDRNKKIIIPIARALGVFVVLFLLLNQNHKAFVSFQPHVEYQDFDESISLYKNPKENQLGFNVIALADEESISIIASDERAVEKKASGEITIFNDFSTEPQRLLPETRFETASGKIFKLGSKELILPGKVDGTPGKSTAIVFADKPGDQQNIDITDLTIPGYKEAGLENKFNGIYAVSNEKFTGGFVGTESYISDIQKEEAENKLKEKLEKRLRLKLQKEKTDQVIIIDDTIGIEYKDPESVFDENKKAGVMSQRGMIFALVVSKESMNQYIGNNFTLVPEGESATVKNINNLSITSNQNDLIDYGNQKDINVSASGSSLLEWNVDVAVLINDIKGRETESLLEYFKKNNALDIANVKIRPFWKKTLPKNIDAIIVK